MKNKKFCIIVAVVMMIILLFTVFIFTDDKGLQKEVIKEATEMTQDILKYEMSQEEIQDLPTTEIIEQTEEEEKVQEQEVESEGFELQGQIAYEGDKATTWNIKLGDYKGLTYYSQLDSRWKSQLYTSKNDSTQTIGSSGCAPTTASMIVTACKGAITPDKMSNLFVKYGYRSPNNGTYLSAFRAVADEFNIEYEETYKLDRAVELLKNNHYIAVSCANGLFTTGGHLILIYGIEGDTLKIYDPYLYSGKFETSTRRGKVTVNGNTVYCTIENFRNYANYTRFFAYKHDGEVQTNNVQPVVTSTYTRYVKANGGLNVRNAPNGDKIGAIANGTKVTVYETNGEWSKIDQGWVNSNYLTNYITTDVKSNTSYSVGKYKVNASLLKVRTKAGTKYKAKTYAQLSKNAREQNRKLGNAKANGYKKGVVCNVTKISENWRIKCKWMDLFRVLY